MPLTPGQKEVLQYEFDRGLTSTHKSNAERITIIANQLNLSVEAVKVRYHLLFRAP